MNSIQRGGKHATTSAGRLRTATSLLVLLLLAACNHGNNFVSNPSAVITPIGYKATSPAGSNSVTITVRAGADVQVTGENSYNGNISVTEFSWAQTDSGAVPAVDLVYRNSSTVSFTAPYVAQPTTLHLTLTVTNALGLKGSSTLQVSVQPANDPNRFLSLLLAPNAVPHNIRVAVSTAAGLSNLSGDVPICIMLSPVISYTPRSGGAGTGSLALPVQRVDAKWVASVGGAAGFPALGQPSHSAGYGDPVVSFQLPALNDELLFAQYNQPQADTSAVANELVPSDIDSAYVQMSVTATPGSCDGTQSGAALANSELLVQLQDEYGHPIMQTASSTPGQAVSINTNNDLYSGTNTYVTGLQPLTLPDGTTITSLTPDDILRATAQLTSNTAIETRESATAYYQTNDPTSGKTTLSTWMSANCFDPNVSSYGVGEAGYNVVHATYANNFDLGFGRDMYFSTCANGNMASVVINYPTIEAVANKIGAFLAVAMEYTPPAGSTAACFTDASNPGTNTGACFAKFYIFSPDDRTGQFVRVLSANFDRRGQKYLPGACTACHGGTPSFAPGSATYSSGPGGAGDINSTFMPWDMSSLLFSDTDPSFACSVSASSPACNSINPSLYTQAAQAPNIQQLNALAWRTYQAPLSSNASFNRFQASIDLLTKWYGGDPAATTAHAFDDSVTPSSWAISGQTAPSDLYHQVFAHYCRACHTQIDNQAEQFTNLTDFAALLAANNPVMQRLVYANAQMPLSRLTADRFWVDFNNGQSAAQTLATYINTLAAASPPQASSVPVDANGNVVGPGAPQVTVNYADSPLQAAGGAPNNLTRFGGASLDALSQSLFVSTYQWSWCSGGPPASAGGACTGTTLDPVGTPIIPAGASAGAPEPGAATPALSTDTGGTSYLTLTANSGIFGAADASFTYPLSVKATLPSPATISGCPSAQANYDGTPSSINVAGCLSQEGDPPYTLQLYDGATYVSCVNTSGCQNVNVALGWMASVVPGTCSSPTCPDPNTGQNTSNPTISFAVTSPAVVGSGPVQFSYQWCANDTGPGSCASGSTSISLVNSLVAGTATFTAYWDPAVNSSYTSIFAPPSGGVKIGSSGMVVTAGSFASQAGIQVSPSVASATAGIMSGPSDNGFLSGFPLSWSAGVLQNSNADISYSPCSHFVTADINGVSLTATLQSPCVSVTGGRVTFDYSLQDGNSADTQQPNPGATIKIQALTSYDQATNNPNNPYVYSILTSDCESCHSSPTTPKSSWIWSSSAATTYANITNSSLGYVVPGQPENSPAYTAPCEGSDVVMGRVSGWSASTPQCQVLYQWILEGGQQN